MLVIAARRVAVVASSDDAFALRQLGDAADYDSRRLVDAPSLSFSLMHFLYQRHMISFSFREDGVIHNAETPLSYRGFAACSLRYLSRMHFEHNNALMVSPRHHLLH